MRMLDPLAAAEALAVDAGAVEAAGALEAAGVPDVEAGGLELDGLDEHPAISAAAAAIATPPAAMRARLSLGIRAAAFAAAHEPTSLAMCVAPLQSRTLRSRLRLFILCVKAENRSYNKPDKRDLLRRGESQPHPVRDYLVLDFCFCLSGISPED
jgi:hypothetical protein